MDREDRLYQFLLELGYSLFGCFLFLVVLAVLFDGRYPGDFDCWLKTKNIIQGECYQ